MIKLGSHRKGNITMIEAQTSPIESAETTETAARIEQWAARVSELCTQRLDTLSTFSQEKMQALRDTAKGLLRLARRGGQAVVLASGLTLLAACGGTESATPTPTAFPTEQAAVPTAVDEEQQPEATFTPQAEAATAPSSVTGTTSTAPSRPNEAVVESPRAAEAGNQVESEQVSTLRLSGAISHNPEKLPFETVSIILPKESTIHNSLMFSFWLQSEVPIEKINFPLSEWLDIPEARFNYTITPTDAAADQLDLKDALLSYAQNLSAKGITIENPEVFAEATIFYAKTLEGAVIIGFRITNEDLIISSASGSRTVNLAELFLKGGAFDIQRFPDASSFVRNSAAPLTVTNILLPGADGKTTGAQDTVFEHEKVIVVEPQPKVTVVPNTGTVVRPQSSVVVGSPEPVTALPTATPIVVRSEAKPVEQETTAQSEHSEGQEYQPNEKIRMSEWWNSMLASGDIVISDMAKQYGGDQIRELNSIVNKAYLIPNPVNITQAYAPMGYLGTCEAMLNKVVTGSDGHIRVSQKAFLRIPGGSECIIITID